MRKPWHAHTHAHAQDDYDEVDLPRMDQNGAPNQDLDYDAMGGGGDDHDDDGDYGDMDLPPMIDQNEESVRTPNGISRRQVGMVDGEAYEDMCRCVAVCVLACVCACMYV